MCIVIKFKPRRGGGQRKDDACEPQAKFCQGDTGGGRECDPVTLWAAELTQLKSK